MAFWDTFDLWSKDDSYIRDCYIALWTFWIIWSLLLLARYFFDWKDRHLVAAPGTVPEMHERVGSTDSTHPAVESQATSPGGASPAATSKPALSPLGAKVARAESLSRNLFVTFLWMLTASALGYGITRGSMIVAWLYFSFAVVWIASELSITHPAARIGFGLTELGLALAVMGIAFNFGW
ncbi:hypothetical protein K493DRAFT_46951 [Basidiobolus meristosporus CBS 931.73]|uniref:Uncharacterized protein n=1 Tax=Basidiobolus meristosporus CBS 931.73 TaxID=1314790 RepID=A0A1Y1ZCZ3_9FUNG|nr:hypothetical protein K493DRAFT_46951 [Basidiobolus meristosporus CBS 931.73]|eukprot:ORY08162.1 hypothetical protein K493DRAFT_46951 [Basidiobolus meristosporus CBS 931.73]